jgi:hypothetical protein
MNTTAEDIYRIYHKEVNLAAGRHVKTVKNFDKAKAKNTWVHFEKCAGFINRNRGQVNPDIFIKSIAEYYEGWFDPKYLTGHKSIRNYKEYVKKRETEASPEHIRSELLRSIAFIAEYCKPKKIDFFQYLAEGQYMIPTVLKHYNAGSVSIYFLCALGGFRDILNGFPPDVTYDYLPNFEEDYPVKRMRIISNPKTKKISENIEIIIQKLIYK